MSLLSDRLRELRGETSQSEMARQLGIVRQQWIKYETGQSAPGAEMLATICRVHACSADWLLGIERGTPAAVVVGNNNAVGTGARVSIRGESAAAGEMPACAKCSIKKRLAQIQKLTKGVL
jgi:transcriptional regulator with XRE-family HTH domain